MKNSLICEILVRGSSVATLIPAHGATAVNHAGEHEVYCRHCLRWVTARNVPLEATLLQHSQLAHR
jgi:hypothetical protein